MVRVLRSGEMVISRVSTILPLSFFVNSMERSSRRRADVAGPAAGLAPAGGYSFPSNFTLFAGPPPEMVKERPSTS